jgi:hypothetical protein
VHYDVRIGAPGYIWIEMRAAPGGGFDYRAVERPRELVLAVTPLRP